MRVPTQRKQESPSVGHPTSLPTPMPWGIPRGWQGRGQTPGREGVSLVPQERRAPLDALLQLRRPGGATPARSTGMDGNRGGAQRAHPPMPQRSGEVIPATEKREVCVWGGEAVNGGKPRPCGWLWDPPQGTGAAAMPWVPSLGAMATGLPAPSSSLHAS